MDSDGKFKTFFGQDGSQSDLANINHILIIPSNTSWNDFGYRTLVNIHFYCQDPDIKASFEGYIGILSLPKEEPNGADYIRKNILLENQDKIIIPADRGHLYFTMLKGISDYRKLVDIFGTDLAMEALLASNDIVAHKDFDSASQWTRQAIESDIFQKSFIRNYDSYYSFKHSGSVLRGIEEAKKSRISELIEVSFKLDGFDNSHSFRFNFDFQSEVPKRTSIVIGENGVGKSQTLGKIASALLGKNKDTQISSNGERVICNRLLAFATSSEAKVIFPNDNARKSKIHYKRFDINRRNSRKKDCTSEVIVDIARSLERIGRISRWDIFISAISAIDNFDQIHLPQKNNESHPLRITTLNQGTGEEHQLEMYASVNTYSEPFRYISGRRRSLSSGEISFLRFAALCCLHIDNSTLVLIDEPETHLHPRFISKFSSILDDILYQTGSAAIIATHSTYLVREAVQEQVHIVKRGDDGEVSIIKPNLRTFGANVGAISFFVFDEDKPSMMASTVEHKLFNKFDSWDSLLEAHGRDLSLEALGSIRGLFDNTEGGTQ